MVLKRVEITNEFGYDELCRRLREVGLKGFPEVKIYKPADIKLKKFSPAQVRHGIFTPQPTVYRDHLDRVGVMSRLFNEQGIDIFNLKGGVDYTATDENGEETMWTLIPPVVEQLPFHFSNSRLDYEELIGDDLRKFIREGDHSINHELLDLQFEEYNRFQSRPYFDWLDLICDGSHRIHFGIEGNINQTLLVIAGPKFGYPYYAASKPYSVVHVEPFRDVEKIDKTHVLTSPAHKNLYRLFPSGGIHSGDVRPEKLGS